MRVFVLVVLAFIVSAVISLPTLHDGIAAENDRSLREKRQFGFGGPFMGGMGGWGRPFGGMGGWGRPWGGMGGWGRPWGGMGGYGGYGGWG
ncbi:hypothetical protein ANCCEY_11825 [Ancylostoma ceylanicum]|uniref:Uncharacterized protein n=2 Tax=Ancylostoma ceylanicum TaxID=53326 RepID=A0A0D6LCW3_9BILA|nr:hypothetical protein ANCCEY_11825 [Ancylostoma ceylanicum]EYC38583.1 hypothetical protein Y032_0708g1716 [Ancylostoma ceylanicum]